MKTCSRCSATKPVSSFGKHVRTSDGLRAACKECERKPPRICQCQRCGESFSFQARGLAPYLCQACEVTHWRCHACREVKPLAEFHNQANSRSGRAYRCKVCTLAHGATEAGYLSRKAASVKARYGISLDEYEGHLLAAEGTCPCCGKSGRKKMCMDHDHVTGEIRGMICSACNSGIGLLGDDVAGLERAIAYLQRVRENA